MLQAVKVDTSCWVAGQVNPPQKKKALDNYLEFEEWLIVK